MYHTYYLRKYPKTTCPSCNLLVFDKGKIKLRINNFKKSPRLPVFKEEFYGHVMTIQHDAILPK